MNLRSFLLVAALGMVGLTAAGVEDLGATGEGDAPEYLSLVRQLGASSYADRALAASKLRGIGIAAKPALLLGLEHDDLEVRLESHRLLVQIIQHDFDARIAAFLDNQGGAGDADLPGWRLFRESVGDSQPTRRLYAAMMRAENDLLVALTRRSGSLEERLADRIRYLTSSGAQAGGIRRSLSDATLATILFIAEQMQEREESRTQANSLATSLLYSVLRHGHVKETVLRGPYSRQIKTLLVGWIEGVHGSQHRNVLQLALDYDLGDRGIAIARKILEDPETSEHTVPYAAIVLGRFGTVEDAKRLEPHLDSTKVFHTWSNRQLKKEPIRIQVRDAVLAMIIRLHGEDPAAYGFNLLKDDDTTIYKVYTLGFLEDSQREAALAKWEARRGADGSDEERERDDSGEQREPSRAAGPVATERDTEPVRK